MKYPSKAKIKAAELFDKYYLSLTELIPIATIGIRKLYAKQHALITAKEILSLFINKCEDTRFWNDVITELNKL